MSTALPSEHAEIKTCESPAITAARQQPTPKINRARFVSDEFFGHQPSATAMLPDPSPLIENLTRCVIEILAGARD
ncbi:MAG: Rv3235 family protein, partial [Rhodoglobus sp.]